MVGSWVLLEPVMGDAVEEPVDGDGDRVVIR